MKKIILPFLIAAASNHAFASFTIDLFGGRLNDASGNAIANGGLVLLVANSGTSDNVFTAPSTTASLTVGSFLSGDDVILASFTINSNFTGFAGGYAASLTNYTYSGNIGSGDLLQLYWFPTLNSSSTTVGQNTAYGTYRTDTANESGSQIAWVLPADSGQSVALQFLTTSSGQGSLADSLGNATLTTVPEPATTVALLGGAAGLFVMYRRRQRKAVTTVSAS